MAVSKKKVGGRCSFRKNADTKEESEGRDMSEPTKSGTPEEFFGNPKNPRLKDFLSKVL